MFFGTDDVNANDTHVFSSSVRPSIQVDADIHDWDNGLRPLRVESFDDQSSLTLSTRIGRRRSSSSIRFGMCFCVHVMSDTSPSAVTLLRVSFYLIPLILFFA
jgi:hypothetical protein